MDRLMSEWADAGKGPRWARLRDAMRCRLRCGAWYPVLGTGWHAVVLDVRGMPLSVHESYLELAFARPTRWSIVARAADAVMMPESWGAWYAVCPNCGAREPVRQSKGTMVCPRCDQGSLIDWSEAAPWLDERTRPTPAHPHAA
ncbi:MAG: hypothetical protein DMD45_16630 [Gemmatimonadetes bacterium]|nr:MAG: hypothetical protein DMD45_16630 [Gemmatimonadota bacterium]